MAGGIIPKTFHDPVAQADIGLWPSASVAQVFVSIGVMSFGFLWAQSWVVCPLSSTSWTACGATPITSWTDCEAIPSVSWDRCLGDL